MYIYIIAYIYVYMLAGSEAIDQLIIAHTPLHAKTREQCGPCPPCKNTCKPRTFSTLRSHRTYDSICDSML